MSRGRSSVGTVSMRLHRGFRVQGFGHLAHLGKLLARLEKTKTTPQKKQKLFRDCELWLWSLQGASL